MDLDYVQRVGIGAAYKGAEKLRFYFGNLDRIIKKGDIDLVTQADIASEKEIVAEIQYRFPDHSILAEESGIIEGLSMYQWIIDPLDGTTNFAHQVGLFAVSIAFAIDGEPIIGTVLNPLTGELFSAQKGHGATLNGKKIDVSETSKVADSLLVTGFPYDFKVMIRPLMHRFEACLTAARGVRRLGSAALDLCYVACGRFEGFWEQHLKPWDTAAGLVIAREAGACVTDFSGGSYTVDNPEILATNGNIHNEMIHLLELNDIR
ncbi:MAG: inositol monophosphatase [Desulfobacteraceae bacterium]|nr:MAG: inositol monophosphatase [Desulfobacteraceae bacterium]